MNTRSEMNVHLYDSSEQCMALPMKFDAFNDLGLTAISQLTLKAECVHMHFWCFDFHKVV